MYQWLLYNASLPSKQTLFSLPSKLIPKLCHLYKLAERKKEATKASSDELTADRKFRLLAKLTAEKGNGRNETEITGSWQA